MAKLGDVCTIVSGTTPKTSIPEYWDGSLNWITPAEIDEDTVIIEESQRKITEVGAKSCGLTPFPAGTVILSSRAPIGKTAIAGTEMYCNQGFKNLICSDNIYNKYLFWFLRGHTEYLKSLGRGATFKEISKKIVQEIEIPLPPMEKQKQIASVLDKVSTLISLRKRQLAKLDELVRARFVEMFGDPVENPHGFDKVDLSELAEIRIGPFGSLLHKEDYIENGHPLVNPSHIISGKIVVDNRLTVSEAKYQELSPYHLISGDVVLGRRGEMGRCAVVNASGLLCGTGSLLIRTKGAVTADYLHKIISFPSFKKTIEDMAVGQTMPNLNVPIVSKFQIIRPPMDVQKEYYDSVAIIEQMKSTIQRSLNKLETLKNALMQDYFN